MHFSRFAVFVWAALPLSAQTTSSTPVTTNAPAIASAPTSTKTADPFSDPVIRQIVVRHRRAVAGDSKETKQLTADLEKLTVAQPHNQLLQAYLGSTYTLCSRDAWPGPGKLKYLRDGDRLLNAAVEADPLNPAVRFVRAIDFFELPAIFGKRQTARDDFQFLLGQVEGKNPLPYTLETGTVQAIYYYSGLSLKQEWLAPQARAAWQRGLDLDPTSELGGKIQAELAKLK